MSNIDHKFALRRGIIMIVSPSSSASIGDWEGCARVHGSITAQIQPSQVMPVKLRCRFEMTAADAPSSHEFCVFEFPGCEGCPKAQHTVRTVGSSEDPMKSEALRAWVAGASCPKKEVFVPIREASYGEVHSQGEPYPVQETSR